MDFQGFVSNLKKPLIISSNGLATQTIAVPKSASFVLAHLRGKGGNGGNGFTRAAGSAGGGGGGGGGGGANFVLLPANIFQGSFRIDISSTGTISLTNAKNLPLASANNGSAGGNGTATVVGALGAAGAVSTFGTYAIETGTRTIQAATAGGVVAGGAGVSTTATNLNTHTGGMGGAGCTTTNFAGGGLTFTSLGGLLVPGGTAAGGQGGHGFFMHDMNYGVGGGGGGSNNSGVGGAGGGGGGYGCGGGGGGAGLTAGTGGGGGPAAAFLYFI
jgi:hypothetical protein